MRIFVVGATGAIGRPLIRKLVDAGHEVTGTTRSDGRTDRVRAAGCEPAVVDILDRDCVVRAVADAKPDVVVHQATDIPGDFNPRKIAKVFESTNRLRTEGTRNLVEAARQAGVSRVVAQSIAFAYGTDGDGPKTEDERLVGDEGPAGFDRIVGPLADLEQTVLGAAGVVLRYGHLYGPGTIYASDGSVARRVRKRQYPVIGDGSGEFSFIHVDDAAAATVAAIERAASDVYNIVDDEPARVRDWLPDYADAIGAPAPRHAPRVVARLLAGPFVTYSATQMRGASNAKAKRELDWQPKYPSWRQGFRQALG